MFSFARLGLLGLMVVGMCLPGQGGWAINGPTGTPVPIQFEYQTINVTAYGVGAPNTSYDCRAYCDASTGGWNTGTTNSGVYFYVYPQPPSNNFSDISAGGANVYHKLGNNTIRWKVDDGYGWYEADTQAMSVIQ